MTCAKQRVIATIITPGGERIVGENSCRTPQPVCPRAGMATGVGYELCRSICDQIGHAEALALALAGGRARGATLYLEGHTYACGPCLAACEAAGVVAIVIGAPPDIVLKPEAFDDFLAMLDNPPEPTEALRELMARKGAMGKLIETDIIAAHRHSAHHRAELLANGRCGCFFCLAVFSLSAITRWADSGQTAICPRCGVDAVIGDQSGYPVTSRRWLERMEAHWWRVAGQTAKPAESGA